MSARILLTPLMLLLSCCAFSQQPTSYKKGDAYFDSLKSQKHSIKPVGNFDKRFSFIDDNKQVKIWGYRLGAMVNNRYKVGIGGYTFKADFDSNITRLKGFTNVSQVNQTLIFGTIFIEPFLIRRKVWELSMLFEIGYGNAIIDSTNIRRTAGKKPTSLLRASTTREHFIPIGIGLSANLNMPDIKKLHFLSYFGLNMMVGMRRVIHDNDFKENYNGFFWSAGLLLFVDRVFTDFQKRKPSPAAVN